MKSDFEERKQKRIEKFERLAGGKSVESETRIKKARDMCSGIPFGQPILVGHHSEKRDRAHRSQIEKNFQKGVEAEKASQEYAEKAEAARNNENIYSDDPAAISKLKQKIAKLSAFQDEMKRINKIYRSKKTDEEKRAELQKIDVKEESINIILSQEFKGFPAWKLTNNNAKIKTAKNRLLQLESQESDVTTENIINGVRIIDNVEDNRAQIFFNGKPEPEIIRQLKRFGFRWTPSLSCWQKHRSSQAMQDAERIVKEI